MRVKCITLSSDHPNSEFSHNLITGENFPVFSPFRHMPSQAKQLVDRMRADEDINVKDDWKLVTIFIGGNDLCLACRQVHKYSAEQYTYYLQETLDILHRDLPRCIVNVVAILQVAELEHFNDIICKSIHL